MWIAISALNLAFAVMLGALEHMVLKLTRVLNNLLGGRLQPTTFLSCAWIVSAWYFKLKVLPHFPIKLSFLLIQIGILFFCGSLYIMALGLRGY